MPCISTNFISFTTHVAQFVTPHAAPFSIGISFLVSSDITGAAINKYSELLTGLETGSDPTALQEIARLDQENAAKGRQSLQGC